MAARVAASAPQTCAMWSLRRRLVTLPAAILLAGLAATVAVYFYRSQVRVLTEMDSGMRLARVLVAGALGDAAGAPDPAAAIERLRRELPTIRHVDFVVLGRPSLAGLGGLAIIREEPRSVPLWFSHLFSVPIHAKVFPVAANGRSAGQIVVVPDPLSEIGEIWDELTFLATLVCVLAAVMVALLVWSVNRGLRPIDDLAEAFDALEHGRFQTLRRPVRVVELHRLGEQFDRLVRSLARVTADNHRLVDRLISLQEAERKEIARELHDEFGPSLFGIRADVSCIVRWSHAHEPRFADIEERARSIAALTDGIQRINARMLDRLRPLVLDQLGLAEALRQLIADWRERCPTVAWSLDMPPELEAPDEETSLTLFRVVQESLTNVARHADAATACVRVRQQAERSGIAVRVTDDGRGFGDEPRFGFGLLGIAERIRACGGRLHVGNGAEAGALLEVFVPFKAAA